MVGDTLEGYADCLLDQARLLEVVRVHQRTDQSTVVVSILAPRLGLCDAVAHLLGLLEGALLLAWAKGPLELTVDEEVV